MEIMKKRIRNLVFLIVCVFALTSARAQNVRTPMEDVVNAIRMGRVEDMDKYFDNFVPITLNNNQSVYSHNQATAVLKDFFEKNSARDLVVMDNGSPTPT